jgi:hypothetical protein
LRFIVECIQVIPTGIYLVFFIRLIHHFDILDVSVAIHHADLARTAGTPSGLPSTMAHSQNGRSL